MPRASRMNRPAAPRIDYDPGCPRRQAKWGGKRRGLRQNANICVRSNQLIASARNPSRWASFPTLHSSFIKAACHFLIFIFRWSFAPSIHHLSPSSPPCMSFSSVSFYSHPFPSASLSLSLPPSLPLFHTLCTSLSVLLCLNHFCACT